MIAIFVVAGILSVAIVVWFFMDPEFGKVSSFMRKGLHMQAPTQRVKHT